MARELVITVNVDNATANQKLAQTDQAVNKVGQTAKSTGGAIDQVDGNLKKLSGSMDTAIGKAATYDQTIGNVAASSATAAKEAKGLATAQEGAAAVTSKLGGLTTLLGGATLGVGAALLAATPLAIQYASSLDRIAKSSGAGVEGAQRLENIAVRTGTFVQNLAQGVSELARRVADGDKSALAAMSKLGISTSNFLNLRADDKFIDVAAALGKVADSGERANLAKDLFSNWQEMLPALTTDVGQFADSIHGLSEQQVEDLVKVEREWEALKLEIKRDIVEIVAVVGKPIVLTIQVVWKGLADVARFMTNPASFLTNPMVDAAQAKGRENLDAWNHGISTGTASGEKAQTDAEAKAATVGSNASLDAILSGINARQKAAASSANEWATALTDVRQHWQEIGRTVDLAFIPLKNYANGMAAAAPTLGMLTGGFSFQANPQLGAGYAGVGTGPTDIKSAARSNIADASGKSAHDIDALAASLSNLSGAFAQLAQVSDGKLGQVASGIGTVVTSMNLAHEASKSMKDGFASIGKDKGDLSGYANVAAGVASAAAAMDAATQSSSKLKRTLGGAATGAEIGSQFGPWGAAIGAGAGALFGLFRGNSEEINKVSPLREEFFRMQGGLEALNPKVLQLSGNLKLVDAVFKAKTVDQYNAAIKDLTDLLGFQDKAMGDLTATAQKYGFTLAELGPALQRQSLDKQAQELYKDFQILTAGGLDHVAILTRMSSSVNEYVQNALQMGVEIPIAMKPMLEAMAQQGVLTDAAGNKIGNLEDAGINFALTMSEGFKALIDEVHKLTTAIAVGLGLAIENIPTPDITIKAHYDLPSQLPSGDWNLPNQDEWTSHGGSFVGATGRLLKFPIAHSGMLPDERMVMVQTGEAIIRRSAVQALGRMNSGQSPTGGSGSTTYQIKMGDIQVLYNGDPNDSTAIAKAIKTALRDNREGIYTAFEVIARKAVA